MAPRSYGTLPSVDNEWDPLTGTSGSDDSSSFHVETEKKKKSRKWAAVGIAGTAVVLAILGIHHLHASTTSTVIGTTSSTNHNKGSYASASWLKSPKSLGLYSVEREGDGLKPAKAWGPALLESGRPLPTNAWYLNLLSENAGNSTLNTEASRVYTIPYIVDTIGKIPGIRVHWPTLQANTRNMQMVVDASNGLTLGATNVDPFYHLASNTTSPLGLALQWNAINKSTKDDDSSSSSSSSSDSMMVAPIVRGMPYATMEYHLTRGGGAAGIIPTVLSGKVLASDPIVDNSTLLTTLKCGLLEDGDDSSSHNRILRSEESSDGGSGSGGAKSQVIQKEISLHFKGSDFTWMIFVSRPVKATCVSAPDPESSQASSSGPGIPRDVMFRLQLQDIDEEGDENDSSPLVVRMALVDECTTGKSTIAAHCDKSRRMIDPDGYVELLRKSAHLYPRGNPTVELEFNSSVSSVDDANTARIVMDWDVMDYSSPSSSSSSYRKNDDTNGDDDDDDDSADELVMYALHYQQGMMESASGSSNAVLDDFCKPTFHGRTCLVKGHRWSLVEDLGPRPSLSAARPPKADSMELLAHTLSEDIHYLISDNLLRGAADTYFSGKVLARVGRVIAIANELKALASDPDTTCKTLYDPALVDMKLCKESAKAAQKVKLPTDHQVEAALAMLRDAVEVWVNGLAEATYVYDKTWGGLINCGCNYTIPKGKTGSEGSCSNTAPYECPALTDVNVDFGNAYYNDHHYHYGYHIYAAAVVAQFDPDWALQWMDNIMLYIRDIANPSKDDPYFPQYRHKDWYLGSSWASGLASFREIHGRNQESSSEAIAAYEGVALFGSAMERAVAIAQANSSNKQDALDLKTIAATAREIHQTGRLLTAMELHGTQRYWHVWNSTVPGYEHVNSYPSQYTRPVVGMLYETMASFQTWFSGGDMASIGIQLLPFTPVAEARDDPVWAAQTFVAYNQSCASDHDFCVKNGWSVMLSGLEATIGQYQDALDDAMLIPDKVFSSEGGCGHSRTNLIWYIATRPSVDIQENVSTNSNVTNTTL